MKLTRRRLLVGGGLIGGGLLIGYSMSGPSRPERAQALAAGEGEQFVTTWLRIDPDNTVTVYVPHAEMGQGVYSSLPMMAAEEMEADWDLVRMVQAPVDDTWANGPLARGYLTGEISIPSALVPAVNWGMFKTAEIMNLQITGGSTSVRFTGHWGMRPAGAAAKQMLIQAAAETWGVPASECMAKLSHVHHKASGRKATFGELAPLAATYDVPSEPILKSKSDYTIVGTNKPRFDIPAKVDGSAKYGMDVRLPGMKYAAIKMSPVFGGKLAGHDGSAALKHRGVEKVIPLENAFVVVADSYWRAKKALDDVEAEFTDGGNGAVSSESIFAQFERDLETGESEEDVEIGDAVLAQSKAARTVEARYRVPFLAHACMEPMNATAHFKDGKMELWTGVQDGLGARAAVADVTGLSADDITLNPMLLGGGFGRRGGRTSDYAQQAALVAMQVDGPVQLVWSREDDVQQDHYRPAVSAHMSAGLDDQGNPVAWINRYVRKDEPVEASHIPYAVADQSIRFMDSPVHVPYGAWRSVAHTQHTFFNESFIDELAHEAGKDPYEYRRALLADKPRHQAVLELAAEKAGWGKRLPSGRALGIAVQESFQTIVAQVAEVSLDEDGSPRVHKVVSAVDCGEVIVPDGARAQIESGIIYGLTAALYGQITIEDGAVVEGNFPDYKMVTLDESPEMEVHFIESGAAIGGLGEPGTPAVAPAIANALFSLTGVRAREMPLMNYDFSKGDRLAFAAD